MCRINHLAKNKLGLAIWRLYLTASLSICRKKEVKKLAIWQKIDLGTVQVFLNNTKKLVALWIRGNPALAKQKCSVRDFCASVKKAKYRAFCSNGGKPELSNIISNPLPPRNLLPP